jgi:hypothetical protein
MDLSVAKLLHCTIENKVSQIGHTKKYLKKYNKQPQKNIINQVKLT